LIGKRLLDQSQGDLIFGRKAHIGRHPGLSTAFWVFNPALR
jgi:hypothetical protein